MQRHHTGSGRRQAIPDDWSAHHRPILAGTRGATIQLRRPGGTRGTFNRATGQYDTAAASAAYFTGAARIQVLPGDEQDQVVAEQEITTLGYAVMLDHALDGMQVDDVVKATAVDGNGDDWLVGRELRVTSIESGSLHWERRLLCTLNLEAA